MGILVSAPQKQIAMPNTNMLVAIAPNIAYSEVLLVGVLPGAEVLRLHESEDVLID